MAEQLKITAVEPRFAIPGGEITITCERFDVANSPGVFVGGERCRVTAASSKRIIANVPSTAGANEGQTHIHIESGGAASKPFPLSVGRFLVDGMHIVANPAIDPSDDAIILTRSGSRGQHLPATLFRLEVDGYLDEFADPVLN